MTVTMGTMEERVTALAERWGWKEGHPLTPLMYMEHLRSTFADPPSPDGDGAHLVALGAGSTVYSFDTPDAGMLEVFPNPADPENTLNAVNGGLAVTIDAPEFTSLCPKTNQPDFGRIVVEYEPDAHCLESKSFKLYLMGYRNHGCFAETIATHIGNDLTRVLQPKWLMVQCLFTPRGGIAFQPRFEYNKDRDGAIPDDLA